MVLTPVDTASLIINHFHPCGRVLDPCRGQGAFFNQIPNCDWCELTEGVDFFKASGHWDWVISNPPWSKFRDFLTHSMKVSDNIVFLCLINACFMKARQRDLKDHNFGIVEILHVDTPPKPWPQAGFSLGAVWFRRNWSGSCSFSHSGVDN